MVFDPTPRGPATPLTEAPKVWSPHLGYVTEAAAKAYNDSLIATLQAHHDACVKAQPDRGTAMASAAAPSEPLASGVEIADDATALLDKVTAAVSDLELRMLGLEADRAEQRRRELGDSVFGLN
jgi:hypothetical protein